ncbi:MAG: threonine ammonia-lyase IlvA [Cytophagaceae bacterium]|nr:threonine ammonia-lyase IlvA [Cytophagaceae bacterium]MDW8455452.1 threonine ammonia-lyase IlvA [Cytophagaceae bacterium]
MAVEISLEHIEISSARLKGIAAHTPMMKNKNLSDSFQASIYLKREDLQVVRSYKIRGAYNLISSLSKEQLAQGVVCASAGNHAQGVAYSCNLLKTSGKIFMPTTTPKQKMNQVKLFGGSYADIILTGDTFDDAYNEALNYSRQHQRAFVHPFDDERIIAGQATVAKEITDDSDFIIDYLFVPIGGGGLAAGVVSWFKHVSPHTKIIGAEPQGAPAMANSIKAGKNIALEQIDKFVDGAAVKKAGDITFEICKDYLSDILLVPEGKVCTTIIRLYNEEAIVAEPAGALTIAALDMYSEKIKNKNVVCILSGGNNDLGRMDEIKERSLLYEGLKHYFIINFPQRAGALREFLDDVLGPDDDITHFEYTKKSMKEYGPALVGIELKHPKDYHALLSRLNEKKIQYTLVNNDPTLFNFLL